MKTLKNLFRKLKNNNEGSVFVEYLLLVTLVGLGIIVGLATLRDSLVGELNQLAAAITALGGGP